MASLVQCLRDNLADFEIAVFQGGNNKQRAHLNEIVALCNAVRDAVKRCDDQKERPIHVFDAWVDGILVQFQIPSTQVEV